MDSLVNTEVISVLLLLSVLIECCCCYCIVLCCKSVLNRIEMPSIGKRLCSPVLRYVVC